MHPLQPGPMLKYKSTGFFPMKSASETLAPCADGSVKRGATAPTAMGWLRADDGGASFAPRAHAAVPSETRIRAVPAVRALAFMRSIPRVSVCHVTHREPAGGSIESG